MTYKASRYNVVTKHDNGTWLVYGCLANGLAKLDDCGYRVYQRFVESPVDLEELSRSDRKIAEQLREGLLILPVAMDETALLRALHYRARFSRTGLALTIVPTLQCNFACDYCYQGRERVSLAMSPGVQDALIGFAGKTLFPGAVLSVNWYGGEPLLCLDIIASLSDRFQRLCREKNASYASSIVTNGYLITSDTPSFFENAGIKTVQITIDGQEEVHNARRPLVGGDGTYARVLDGTLTLAKSGIANTLIRINVDRRNEHNIPSLLRELASRGLTKFAGVAIGVAQVQVATGACADVEPYCHSSFEFSLSELELARLAMRLGFRVTQYPRFIPVNCGAITPHHFVVEPDGTLQRCWNAVGQPDKAVGHVLQGQQMVDELCRVNDTRWLGWNAFAGKCPDCQVFPLCFGGCPFKDLYPNEVSPVSRDRCITFRYNSAAMLPVFVEARKQGLLTL